MTNDSCVNVRPSYFVMDDICGLSFKFTGLVNSCKHHMIALRFFLIKVLSPGGWPGLA
jgi:hypothetical protein